MRLLAIYAKNFRTLQDIEIKFSSNYCTISGKNNAGKSSVIRLLTVLFGLEQQFPWLRHDQIDYAEDVTQWLETKEDISIDYILEISRDSDPSLMGFVEKIASRQIKESIIELKLQFIESESGERKKNVFIGNQALDQEASKHISKKIHDANCLFLYNSTTNDEMSYMISGPKGHRFYDFVISKEEEKELEVASKGIEKKVRRIARQHTESLNNIFGRLIDKYDIELTPQGKFVSKHAALRINLKDRNAEVSLSDWGSGTQNRTQILMSILQANRIKTTNPIDDKITPIVVLEEPECFLHPSAQAEFGKLLGDLSSEFGVQIIATTHSPYMLNRSEPKANILLCRDNKKRKKNATIIVDTSSEAWMAPFAEHLGISKLEFNNWKAIFQTNKEKLLLVEGEIDKKYFENIQERKLAIEELPSDIEIVPYGGKNALTNTLLVKFVLSRFDNLFITYDLDAADEIEKVLLSIGLVKDKDFMPIGLNKPGKDRIEGILPDRILSIVHSRETELMMKLTSKDSKERTSAKNSLKNLYLEEFKKNSNYTKDELKDMNAVIKAIIKGFKSK